MDKKTEEKLLRMIAEIKRLYGEEVYEQCLEYCEKILADYPYDFNTLAYKGACLNKLEKYEEAIKVFTKCISVEGDQYYVYVLRGDSFYKLEYYESAVDDYKKSIELDPTNGAAYDNCARSLFWLGKYDEAFEYIKKAFEIGNDPNSLIVMGNMFKRLGLKQEEYKTMSLGASTFPEDKRFDDYRN